MEKKLKLLTSQMVLGIIAFVLSACVFAIYVGLGSLLAYSGFVMVFADTRLSNDFLIMFPVMLILFGIYGFIVAIVNLINMILSIVSRKINNAMYDSVDARTKKLTIANNILRILQIISNLGFVVFTSILAVVALMLNYDWNNLGILMIIDGVLPGLFLLAISGIQFASIFISAKASK
ncbi:MAG: hypothetical protein MJ126_10585 [Lachnospiraceae bacterium]|nr:hypothetical protein [Lachnospiraceae bacterium]